MAAKKKFTIKGVVSKGPSSMHHPKVLAASGSGMVKSAGVAKKATKAASKLGGGNPRGNLDVQANHEARKASDARQHVGKVAKTINKVQGRTEGAAKGVGGQAGFRKAPTVTKQTHALQKGKRGGSFYVVNGKKVYAKK